MKTATTMNANFEELKNATFAALRNANVDMETMKTIGDAFAKVGEDLRASTALLDGIRQAVGYHNIGF